jgi:hypothetical protein
VTRRKYAAFLPDEPGEGEVLYFILDRYGAPHVASTDEHPNDAALHPKFLDWLYGIELECPE